MARYQVDVEVLGPWSLNTSRAFWEGFAPAALPAHDQAQQLRTVFCAEQDWRRAEVTVTQHGSRAQLTVTGNGDLDAAAVQACRFLSLDVDARGWPDVAKRDAVIADAQAQLPGLRPCGFHSPYEAAAWSVLSQRIRITQAARLRNDLVARHGDDGAFPAPGTLRGLDLDLPGRKTEYLHAVAEAALEGRLDAGALRAVDPAQAARAVQEVEGLGPFAAELVVIRGANAPDALPQHERQLEAEISKRYGTAHHPAEIAQAWRPYRTWAAVHLRTLREQRTHEISAQASPPLDADSDGAACRVGIPLQDSDQRSVGRAGVPVAVRPTGRPAEWVACRAGVAASLRLEVVLERGDGSQVGGTGSVLRGGYVVLGSRYHGSDCAEAGAA